MPVSYGERFDNDGMVMFYRTIEHEPWDETEKGWTTEDAIPAACVTVYQVLRYYGGPEEGGWWYDWLVPLCSLPLLDATPKEVAELTEILEARFPKCSIFVEPEAGHNETKDRPRYE